MGTVLTVLIVLVLAGCVLWFQGAVIIGLMATAWFALLATFAGAFLFGTFGFWALIVLSAIAIIFSIDEIDTGTNERDYAELAPFVILGTLIFLQLFGDIRVFTYVRSHPWYHFLGWIVAYIAVGYPYTLFRWWWYVSGRTAEAIRAKSEFFKRNKITENTIPADLSEVWRYLVADAAKPRFYHHVARLTHWWALWPWSLVWFLLSDFIKNGFRRLVRLAKRSFEFITNLAWREVEREFSGITVEETPPAPSPRPDEEMRTRRQSIT